MTERYEARIRDEPGQLWGVWDCKSEVWRETLLGTSEETDARNSAEMLNAIPSTYQGGVAFKISRPPYVHPLLLVLLSSTVVVCIGLVLVFWGDPALMIAFTLIAASLHLSWIKLVQVARWKPHVTTEIYVEPQDEES